MAETTTTEKAATEPQIDMSKLQDAVSASVTAALTEAGRSAAAQQEDQRRRVAAAEAAKRTGEDPIASVLAPHLNPILGAVNLSTADAKDAAVFYPTNPRAQRYSAEIEAKFNECIQRGSPMNRASIWQWIQGSPAFQAEMIKEHDAELERARQAQTLIGNRGGMPSTSPEVGPDSSDDDIAKAVEGLQF